MADARTRGATRRILILAPNWLGDAIMAAPVLGVLRRALWPDPQAVRITWAVREPWAPLFADDGRIDSLLTVDRAGRHAGAGGLWRLAREVRDAVPDAILLGPPSLRAALVGFLGRVPVRIGYRSDGRSALLTHRLRFAVRGQEHYTTEMVRLAKTLLSHWGVEEGPRIAATSGEVAGHGAGEYLPGCAQWPADESEGPALWALAPGTTFGPAKTWPAGRMAELIGSAVSERGRRVVLLGDGGAAPLVAELRERTGLAFRRELDGEAGVIDLCGRTDLRRLVAILKAAEGFVGNDSGLMHLAGALGRPTVGIFGSSNPAWTGPAGDRSSFLVAEGFPCRPCYRRVCDQPRFCLETIGAHQVMERLDAMIAVGSEPGRGS